jgi:hypothetical protein
MTPPGAAFTQNFSVVTGRRVVLSSARNGSSPDLWRGGSGVDRSIQGETARMATAGRRSAKNLATRSLALFPRRLKIHVIVGM